MYFRDHRRLPVTSTVQLTNQVIRKYGNQHNPHTSCVPKALLCRMT